MMSYVIELLERISLTLGAISSNRADVEHACSELNECASLHWDIDCGEVGKGPVEDSLEVILSNELRDALLPNELTILVRHQAVLGEAVVEHVEH